MTPGELFEDVDAGILTPDHKIWKLGMAKKVPARKVNGLFTEAQLSEKSPSSATPAQLEPLPPEAVPVPEEAHVGPGLGETGHGKSMCPCCWYRFNPEDALFLASHPELIGDAVLGQYEPKRFLPTRFTPDGLALDEKGMRCTDLACPRCHMRLPSQVLTSTPFFVSIVGGPGSGKSHVMAAAIWNLRTLMPGMLDHSFMDADATTNLWLNDYEAKLFFTSGEEAIGVIDKTDEATSHVYKRAHIEKMDILLPNPCVFCFSPLTRPDSPKALILYDNAGETFMPNQDTILRPATLHLVRSEGVVFLLDPISDPRLRNLVLRNGHDIKGGVKPYRQDVLLVEMISRIRRHAGLANGELYDKPLVIGLSKADLFNGAFDMARSPLVQDPSSGGYSVDFELLRGMSAQVRSFLRQHTPEIVSTVESFARQPIYMPISALGHNPLDQGTIIDGARLTPRWTETPFLYFLAKSGHIPFLNQNNSVPAGSAS
jgi:hypothetical protein